KFVRFCKRCHTEDEAVTWALRRSQVWIDTRLQHLNRKGVGQSSHGIDMLEASENQLARVAPEQSWRARSATEPGLEKSLTFHQFKCALAGCGLKLNEQILQKSYAALVKLCDRDHWSWLETRQKVEHAKQDLAAAVSSRRLPAARHIPLTERAWRRMNDTSIR
ncbi:MAG: hypothetical protein ACREO5_02495, partial [Candidatus Binatia bacterium]